MYSLINPVTFYIFYSKFIIIVLSLSLIIVYSLWIYPEISQELGGAKPRKCIIECRKGLFNSESVMQLFKDSSASVLRSKEILIYYSNSDKIILKEDEHSQTYELNRKDITLIHWINERADHPE